MFRPGLKEKIQAVHRHLQEKSKFPLLLAANLEYGGSGIVRDGTAFANPMQAAAVGCNWSFAPVADLDMNFRNPVTNIRTFGSDARVVSEMSEAYVRVCQDNGLAATVKHFPGDGVDERDQHLMTTVNTLSVAEWDVSFGHVYRTLIRSGTKTVMAGFTMALKREQAVPLYIAAGCDMLLFNRDIRENIGYTFQGIRTGVLSLERVDEAVTRILALKASLGLHLKDRANLVPDAEALRRVSCGEHQALASEVL